MKITDEMVERAADAVAYPGSTAWRGSRREVEIRENTRKALEAGLRGVETPAMEKANGYARALRRVHNDVQDEKIPRSEIASAIWSVLHDGGDVFGEGLTRKWDFHSDEEIAELAAGASERANNAALPPSIITRARVLADELYAEKRRRQGGYQGPGFYNVGGQETEVLGDIHSPSGRLVIYRRPDLANLAYISLEAFESSDPGHQYYLHPLPGGES